MEKYILKAVFILTLISTMSREFAFALNKPAAFIGSDTGKLIRKFYVRELKSPGRSMDQLSSEELDSMSKFLILEADTGKYYKYYRKFFKDAAGLNKKFVDSLILNFPKDSILRGFRFHADSNYKNRGWLFPDHRDNSIEMPNMLRKEFPRMNIDKFELPDGISVPQKNSQLFSFRNTDKDGITTRIRIEVNDVSKEESEKIQGKNSDEMLNVQDLSLSPNFSSNKITLMFRIPTKGAASVKVLDSDFKEIYSDQVSQSSNTYNKAISMPKNGIYFLVIRQNGKAFIKRLIKQG